jgi:sugar lactone lactonase YvrE
MPRLTSSTVVGSGFVWRANKAAFIQAPTGVALSSNGTLYVAETVTNRVSKIPDAMTRAAAVPGGGSTLSAGGWLNGPLGVTLAPNGDVIAMNGNDGNAVEISPQGHQVAKVTLVTNGAGDLFGATVASGGRELVFVNDGTNALDIASTR